MSCADFCGICSKEVRIEFSDCLHSYFEFKELVVGTAETLEEMEERVLTNGEKAGFSVILAEPEINYLFDRRIEGTGSEGGEL